MFTMGAPLRLAAVAQTSTLLNHFDGTHGSTSFIDQVPGQTWGIGGGSPIISTVRSKFGGSSLFCPNGSWIGCTSLSGKLPSADYSVDFWCYATYDCEFAISIDGAGFNVAAQIYSGTTITHRRDGTAADCYFGVGDGGGSVLNRWVHVFIGRAGATDYVACNGVMSSQTNPNTVTGTVTQLEIGMFNYFTSGAYFDELRVLIGSCGYTSSFSPPTAPYA